MRIGIGIDVHQFAEGRKLIIGGVEVPSPIGLLGHSDADVLLHAISDALLGAAALGDIGKHFPDTSPDYKDADSMELLRHVCKLLEQEGYKPVNVDTMLLLEKPKIAPYIDQMRRNIARCLGLEINAVSVKATTNEKLGYVGRQEGACAHAVCLIENA
ncbi:MAG TPA: 2-C-methyl-D-erythritol 2,4-cyclodiphosphate synthase [Chlorobaculum sp.]|uniref:2-C-methyl-D-erythritol 2,4-cyclodiphosphate synthase n=1 Tax=Chlorobaculum tepidum (strain ATCC 49652 / DSM 12025 / NBRC 103806 / TLS) TaxID=194439 RepID=ISPF_CHLTE|nr:2-C-methyl-D-erythritol 2,4-cyclodiphosphate synthase [Chlorobaculum tepidum]Q8KC25.1 RecName: Full=2-C-methyl-D-erythritol 2,4-cyclodiphosphate synthase; Short=MECDP-synthase; Short=MECPP-synthase; Short=MECPS [Chlorobaculum tepidum TLS]AAM72826.1 2C-methyl-D-erythritol 2,4-cyclodiphosphate synthase [Chlorobaculum tepidum TLS]HBU22454.1 2-C-methyl-D-erythritol 2,4-cyclodiphosphate synthase [Chlorobaculum sp.]